MPARAGANEPNVAIERLPPAARDRLGKLQLPRTGFIGSEGANRIAAAANAGQLTFDEVRAIMPAYIAYVWYDTGKRLGVGPSAPKLLAPQPSFGMFAWHDGDANGWRQSFVGKNVTEISPNFYRVSVPQGGAVRVSTLVTACQWPICLDHYLSLEALIIYIGIALLLLIGAIVIIIVIRRAAHP